MLMWVLFKVLNYKQGYRLEAHFQQEARQSCVMLLQLLKNNTLILQYCLVD